MWIKFFVRKTSKEKYSRQMYDFPRQKHEVQGPYYEGFWNKYRIDRKIVDDNGDLCVYATVLQNKALLYQ